MACSIWEVSFLSIAINPKIESGLHLCLEALSALFCRGNSFLDKVFQVDGSRDQARGRRHGVDKLLHVKLAVQLAFPDK